MTKQIKIAPSLLAADFTRLGEQMSHAEKGGADWFHFDVMDGRFVSNISMGLPVLQSIKSAVNVPIDVHLMIVEPENYIKQFAKSGADSISVHVEVSPHLHRNLSLIQKYGSRVGVALNPHTPASAIKEVMHLIDVINVMTVDPGFGGQSFLNFTLSKIRELRTMADAIGRDIDIEVDGGVNAETAPLAIEAGANVLIAGTMIFRNDAGVEAGIRQLRNAATSG